MNQSVDLLKQAKVLVSPETYNVISLSKEEWKQVLQNPDLSPRMETPFMVFKDEWEVTLVLDDPDFETIRHAIRDAKVERGFRLLSFDIELEFEVVGFMAVIAKIFSEAGISIFPISSFSRDHVLLRQSDLATALKALRGHVDEIC